MMEVLYRYIKKAVRIRCFRPQLPCFGTQTHNPPKSSLSLSSSLSVPVLTKISKCFRFFSTIAQETSVRSLALKFSHFSSSSDRENVLTCPPWILCTNLRLLRSFSGMFERSEKIWKNCSIEAARKTEAGIGLCVSISPSEVLMTRETVTLVALLEIRSRSG